MNREILFRGKRTDNGEWVEGLPSYAIDGAISEIHSFKHFMICEIYEVDPETVGQYIGKTDDNGEKIFTGHIVSYRLNYGGSTDKVFCGIIDIVDFMVCIIAKDTEPLYIGDAHGIQIIGDTTDNPELITTA